MRVIDLLNKIANGEEVPKKLKIDDWEYDEESEDLETELLDRLHWEDFSLNDEVEIIEEPQEHKIPEKLPFYSLEKIQKAKNKDEWREERILLLEKRINDYHSKINEIIDYLEEENE